VVASAWGWCVWLHIKFWFQRLRKLLHLHCTASSGFEVKCWYIIPAEQTQSPNRPEFGRRLYEFAQLTPWSQASTSHDDDMQRHTNQVANRATVRWTFMNVFCLLSNTLSTWHHLRSVMLVSSSATFRRTNSSRAILGCNTGALGEVNRVLSFEETYSVYFHAISRQHDLQKEDKFPRNIVCHSPKDRAGNARNQESSLCNPSGRRYL